MICISVKGSKPLLSSLNSDTRGIDICIISPFAYTRLPCPQVVIQHMMDRSIFTNHIMCTDLGLSERKCMQRLFAAVLCGVMNDHKIRFAQIEIGCSNPLRTAVNNIALEVLFLIVLIDFLPAPYMLCLMHGMDLARNSKAVQ